MTHEAVYLIPCLPHCLSISLLVYLIVCLSHCLSVSLLVRNCTSGYLFISWPRIIYIRLFYQIDLLLGTYIQKTRYQSVYKLHIKTSCFTIRIVYSESCISACSGSCTIENLALFLELYIRKVVCQLIQDKMYQVSFSGMINYQIEYPAI